MTPTKIIPPEFVPASSALAVGTARQLIIPGSPLYQPGDRLQLCVKGWRSMIIITEVIPFDLQLWPLKAGPVNAKEVCLRLNGIRMHMGFDQFGRQCGFADFATLCKFLEQKYKSVPFAGHLYRWASLEVLDTPATHNMRA